MLRDVQTFVAAFDTLFGGFRARAEQTYQLLRADETAFVVVASPEPDALREAAFFVERLDEERMPLAGLVLNRVSAGARAVAVGRQALAAAERLEAGERPSGHRRAAAPARRPRLGWSSGSAAARRASPPRTRTVPTAERAGAGRPTCTTWTRCARSATLLADGWAADPRGTTSWSSAPRLQA